MRMRRYRTYRKYLIRDFSCNLIFSQAEEDSTTIN
jgi:hypothetical protein